MQPYDYSQYLVRDLTNDLATDRLDRLEPGLYLLDANEEVFLLAEIDHGRVVRWRAVSREGNELPVSIAPKTDADASSFDVDALDRSAQLIPQGGAKKDPLPKVEGPDAGSGGAGGSGKVCLYVCAPRGDGGQYCWLECT